MNETIIRNLWNGQVNMERATIFKGLFQQHELKDPSESMEWARQHGMGGDFEMANSKIIQNIWNGQVNMKWAAIFKCLLHRHELDKHTECMDWASHHGMGGNFERFIPTT